MWLRIEPKNRACCHIYLDDTLWGTLPVRVLQALYPRDHQGEITAVEGDALIRLLQQEAVRLLQDYLSLAEHSSFQCRNLLRRRNFHASLIDTALDRCRENGYLDDSRFAELLIRSYLNRSSSRRAIIAKLRNHQIGASIWEPLLAELYDKDEAAGHLKELMQKYCVRHRELPRPKLKEKVFNHLFRKGFEVEDIMVAWEESGIR